MSGNYNKNDIVQVEVDNDSDLCREIIQLEVR